MEELRLRDDCVLVQSISAGFTVGIVPRDRAVGRVCNILDIDKVSLSVITDRESHAEEIVCQGMLLPNTPLNQ